MWCPEGVKPGGSDRRVRLKIENQKGRNQPVPLDLLRATRPLTPRLPGGFSSLDFYRKPKHASHSGGQSSDWKLCPSPSSLLILGRVEDSSAEEEQPVSP